MSSGPPVKRTLPFDQDKWDRIGRIARELGTSPDELIAGVATRIELSQDGDLRIAPRK